MQGKRRLMETEPELVEEQLARMAQFPRTAVAIGHKEARQADGAVYYSLEWRSLVSPAFGTFVRTASFERFAQVLQKVLAARGRGRAKKPAARATAIMQRRSKRA